MPVISTSLPNFSLRFATQRDLPTVFSLIQELASYEKRPEDMTATLKGLSDGVFSKGYAEVLLAEHQGKIIGYALFYPVFASFAGQTELFLEDFYITTEHRKKGFGSEMLRQLAKLANSRGWRAMRWNCLSWNSQSINFYEGIGAKKIPEHVSFSLQGNALKNFINS